MTDIKTEYDDSLLDDDPTGSSRKRKRNAPKRIEIENQSETTSKKIHMSEYQSNNEQAKSDSIEISKLKECPNDQKKFSIFNVSNSLQNPLFNSHSDSNNNSAGQTISITALMQALQILQQQQQLQAQQQQQHLASALAFNSLINNTNGTTNNSTSNNITESTEQLSLLLQYLPLPSPSLPTYPLLYAQYVSIGNHFQSLIQMINQYNTSLQQAMKTMLSQQIIKTNIPPTSESNSPQKTFFESKGPCPNQIFPPASDEGSRTWKNVLKKENTVNPILPKKANFRGTSEYENLVDPNFEDLVADKTTIRLSEAFPDIVVSREIYYNILTKSSKSATRIIRLLMKHFFNQEQLAASSLSGEGIYKKRLDPDIIEAIKSFIRRRHPNLKNGSISLCMTDVCVQARRVANNQRSRGQVLSPQAAPEMNPASPISENANSLSICLDQQENSNSGFSPLTNAANSVPNLLTPLDDDQELNNNDHLNSYFPKNGGSFP